MTFSFLNAILKCNFKLFSLLRFACKCKAQLNNIHVLDNLFMKLPEILRKYTEHITFITEEITLE